MKEKSSSTLDRDIIKSTYLVLNITLLSLYVSGTKEYLFVGN